MSQTMNSEFILIGKNFSVTKTLVKIGKKSYPINGIGSVDIERPNLNKGIAISIWAILLGGYLSYSLENMTIFFIAAFIFAGGIALAMQNALVFRTSSGDQQALVSNNKKELQEIKTAIEQAVSLRG